MKAIHQIISYLNEYGQLTREELIALTARGFYPLEVYALRCDYVVRQPLHSYDGFALSEQLELKLQKNHGQHG